MFIRTKNGVYEVVEDNNKEWGKQIVVKFPKNLNMKLADVKDQILKQADSIEELCDEFVYECDKVSKHERCWKGPNTSKWYDYDTDGVLSKKEIATIRGGIWTDKGFIYVAKMNENGDLESI